MALSISSLMSFFFDQNNSVAKGENHFRSGHVESCHISSGFLQGQVHASMKKKIYTVSIYLNEKHEIISSECECPRGEYKCSHAAALYIHGIYNISRTDTECVWKKKKSGKLALQSAAEMFPSTKPSYTPLLKEPTTEDHIHLQSELSEHGSFTGLYWLMGPEPGSTDSELPIKTIDKIISSRHFQEIHQSNKLAYFKTVTKIIDQTIPEIATITKGQRENSSWHQVRKGRLTASNFGPVLRSRTTTGAPSLIKKILVHEDISHVKAIKWGIDNEEEAIKSFQNMMGVSVNLTGIWLDTCGILGASPDGLVGDQHVLEVKCSYSHRYSTISQAAEDKHFCLEDQNGVYTLKKNHDYWQ